MILNHACLRTLRSLRSLRIPCHLLAGLVLWLALPLVSLAQDAPVRALIVDGQNNHGNWPETTEMMKSYLESSGKFSVDVARTKPKGTDEEYQPKFSDYDVVVTNYNGAPWPESTKKAFVDYMQAGGGLVVVHAADNAFSDWPEYNQIIGLGGWGGRNQDSGPYVYYNQDGKVVRDASEGNGGHHGSQHEFSVVIRDDEHPITKGLPREWLHMKDELYDQLRGPAENMKVLATSFSSKKFGGSERHEPMLMTIEFGKGRVFHTPMGHGNYSQECVGFITVFLRGAEWAATGNVTMPVPDDFPGANKTSSRPFVPPAKVEPNAESFKKDLARMMDFLKAGDARKTIEAIATPAQAQELFEQDEVEEFIKVFQDTKAPRLLSALQSVAIEDVIFENDKAEVEIDGRPMHFQFVEGHWRIQN